MTYPPTTPFMQLTFPDREAVFMRALRLYHASLVPGYRRDRGGRVGKLARLQLYVCGREGAALEPWMLGEGAA